MMILNECVTINKNVCGAYSVKSWGGLWTPVQSCVVVCSYVYTSSY
jgi:hypothetical protein